MMRSLLPSGLLVALVACGGGKSSPAPTPTPTPTPQPTTATLRGQVSEAFPFSANKIVNAKVEFTDGTNAGKFATTDADGVYVISNANLGGFTVRATADGFQADSSPVTLTTSTAVLDFQLAPAGPRKKFGPGQYRVNTEIAPGRYYSVPSDGCYFERQKGFGGTVDDIIANDFIGFNAGQWIVDIKSTDLAFQTDEDCGTWYNTPRAGAQATITPGMWLVGSQIKSGTYRAATSPGCYWERLKNFSNTIGGVIANDFVSGGGARSVSIRKSDLGFDSDDDCGVWMRTGSSSTGSSQEALSVANREQSATDILRNRELHQRRLASPKPLTNGPEE